MWSRRINVPVERATSPMKMMAGLIRIVWLVVEHGIDEVAWTTVRPMALSKTSGARLRTAAARSSS
jgi:hypothetical protein